MKRWPFGTLIGVALVTGFLAPAKVPARPTSTAPEYALLDESGSIPPTMAAALRRLLTEHDHVTDEQVVLAVFTSSGDETPEALTRRVFDEWKIGNHGKDNGALLAIFLREKQGRMMAGSGLDDVLGESERKRIVAEKVAPELAARDAARAAALGVLEILRSLRSPLVSDGRAERELRAGGFMGSFRPREWTGEPMIGARGGWLLFLLGITAFGVVFLFVMAAEAHFTSSGWYRPSPWRWARWKFELWNPKTERSSLGGTHGQW